MDDVIGLPARHKLDVHAFHRMAEAGIFRETDRVELIEGDLIDMAPIGAGHASVVDSLSEALILACGGRATVRIQNPIRLDEWNEPQPDLAILKRRGDFYAAKYPGPADTLLVIEVADTSAGFDRTVKLPLYARAGIPEYWIVDLTRRRLEAHRAPSGGSYTEITTHSSGETLALSAAPDIAVDLSLVLA